MVKDIGVTFLRGGGEKKWWKFILEEEEEEALVSLHTAGVKGLDMNI